MANHFTASRSNNFGANRHNNNADSSLQPFTRYPTRGPNEAGNTMPHFLRPAGSSTSASGGANGGCGGRSVKTVGVREGELVVFLNKHCDDESNSCRFVCVENELGVIGILPRDLISWSNPVPFRCSIHPGCRDLAFPDESAFAEHTIDRHLFAKHLKHALPDKKPFNCPFRNCNFEGVGVKDLAHHFGGRPRGEDPGHHRQVMAKLMNVALNKAMQEEKRKTEEKNRGLHREVAELKDRLSDKEKEVWDLSRRLEERDRRASRIEQDQIAATNSMKEEITRLKEELARKNKSEEDRLVEDRKKEERETEKTRQAMSKLKEQLRKTEGQMRDREKELEGELEKVLSEAVKSAEEKDKKLEKEMAKVKESRSEDEKSSEIAKRFVEKDLELQTMREEARNRSGEMEHLRESLKLGQTERKGLETKMESMKRVHERETKSLRSMNKTYVDQMAEMEREVEAREEMMMRPKKELVEEEGKRRGQGLNRKSEAIKRTFKEEDEENDGGSSSCNKMIKKE